MVCGPQGSRCHVTVSLEAKPSYCMSSAVTELYYSVAHSVAHLKSPTNDKKNGLNNLGSQNRILGAIVETTLQHGPVAATQL